MLSYNHSTRVKEKFRKYILAQTFVIVVRLLCKYSICHISTLTKNPETRLLVFEDYLKSVSNNKTVKYYLIEWL